MGVVGVVGLMWEWLEWYDWLERLVGVFRHCGVVEDESYQPSAMEPLATTRCLVYFGRKLDEFEVVARGL